MISPNKGMVIFAFLFSENFGVVLFGAIKVHEVLENNLQKWR